MSVDLSSSVVGVEEINSVLGTVSDLDMLGPRRGSGRGAANHRRLDLFFHG